MDASDWEKWHYIDLKEVAETVEADPSADISSLWKTYSIPTPSISAPGEAEEGHPAEGTTGIYTYWYDVFGEGTSNRAFREFAVAERQEEPENWTIAIHRDNVRTNGCSVAVTGLTSIDDLTADLSIIERLQFTPDSWNETDVWVVRDRMLSGMIGNQGIMVNEVLGQWLTMEIPPMPPVYRLNPEVFVVRLPDNTYAALQLTDYIDSSGTKCHLSINYRYPL